MDLKQMARAAQKHKTYMAQKFLDAIAKKLAEQAKGKK